jgi:uncharacterized cofD-like protein
MIQGKPPFSQKTAITAGSPRWFLMLLRPGIGLKRWLALAALGLTILGLGASFGLSFSLSGNILAIGRAITFSDILPNIWRGVIFIGVGSAIFLVAGFMFYRRVAFAFSYVPGNPAILQNLSRHLDRSRGPKLVVIGGGTGLSTLLRGVKHYTEDITAIVTVADDGGSSGRLRSEIGISPPGDARQCLIALSESEPLMEQVLSYRFVSDGELHGHSLGNLLLAALTDTYGNFHEALQVMAKLLAVKGRVVPATNYPDLKIMAETKNGETLDGESAIGHAGQPLTKLWIEPEGCEVNPAAAQAILDADAIVIGPGSLYTSVLPNFLVPGIAEATRASTAMKIFVCNVATQHGETDKLSGPEHLGIFVLHSGVQPTHFLVNNNALPIPKDSQQTAISAERPNGFAGEVVMNDLVDTAMPTRHDPEKLASVLMGIARRGSWSS